MEKFSKDLILNEKIYFDKHLASNLNEINKMIELNFDGVLLVDGMEGSGKSELGKQICFHTDSTFSANDVFYTTDQFEEWLENAPKGKAGLWDEFVLAGLSSDALSEMQKILIKKFTMIRKKNLIIVLVIPYLFLLRKYFAVARTRCLIHVYTKGSTRGYFDFYNYEQKLWIYNYGYKTWIYSGKVSPSFHGRFQAWADRYLDVKAIEDRKDQAIEDVDEKQDKTKLLIYNLCKMFQIELNGKLDKTLDKYADIISRGSFYKFAKLSKLQE